MAEMRSLYAEVFNTWMDLAHVIAPSPRTAEELRRAALRVSVREIREEINSNRRSMGDVLTSDDELRTNDQREPMRAMGFEVGYKGHAGSRTFVEQTPYFASAFDSAMERYGTDAYRTEYEGLKEASAVPSGVKGVKGVKPQKCAASHGEAV